MKLSTVMGNAAMTKAVENGLIPNGVTSAQRAQLDEVLQAAIDAHATLRAFDEINFAVLTDPAAIDAAIESGR